MPSANYAPLPSTPADSEEGTLESKGSNALNSPRLPAIAVRAFYVGCVLAVCLAFTNLTLTLMTVRDYRRAASLDDLPRPDVNVGLPSKSG